jgi:hypothetical protein
MKNKITLKFIMLFVLLPLILITINPLLITIFDESYLRFIIKYTTFNLDIIDRVSIQIVELEDAAQDAADEAAEMEADIQDTEELLQELSSITGLSMEQISNQLLAENPGFNPNEITETSSPNTVPNELDTNNDYDSQNSNSDIDMISNSSTDSDSDSDVSIKSDSDSDSDSDMDTTSSISESISPLPILLTKLNKVKTTWNKLINTPIVFDKVIISRQNHNLKLIMVLLFLPLLLITINPLLLTVFDDRYLRYVTKFTHNYFRGPHAHLVDQAVAEELQAELNTLIDNFSFTYDEATANAVMQQMQDIAHQLTILLGENNNQNVMEDNNPNAQNELDNNNSETDNNDSDENIGEDVGTNTDSNSFLSLDSDSNSDSDSGTDFNSSNGESLLRIT